MAKVLIVEDDAALARGIALALPGCECTVAHSLLKARAALARCAFDLLLLDVGLPDGSGLSLCREVRQGSEVAIVFLTANGAEYDEVAGLEAGADDYVVKPFSLAVLRARVEAALRRGRGAQQEDVAAVGDLLLNFTARRFTKGGKPLELNRMEQRLLHVLIRNRGRVLTRDTLFEAVWKDEFVDENTLSVAVSRLRAKLEDDPRKPRCIQTVYGVGYTWAEDGHE